MIFHDYVNHMMDWVFQNWIFMVLCAGAIILLIIVFLYLYNHSKSRNQLKNNIIINDRVKSNITDVQEIELRQSNFCPNCGKKFDTTNVKFCPYCGERI
ncbi:MAG: hypothetical protein ACFFB9_05275 [Promethearchaeota archaeon]